MKWLPKFWLCAALLAWSQVPVVGYAADTPIAVQFEALTLPAISEKGYRGRTTVTPYMKVKNAEALARLCARLPRLLDVMLVAFEDKPVLLSDRVNDLAARQEELAQQIEGSLGKGIFEGFYLIQGTKLRGEGTELLRIDGGMPDCQPIKYLPWERKPPEVLVEIAKAPIEPQTQRQKFNRLSEMAQVFSDQASPPSPLSDAQLAAAEKELLADIPERKPFPSAPSKPGMDKSWILTAIAIVGMGGLMLVIGSYIGYQVAKIRRDRRRAERRLERKNRRSGIERRQRQDGPPEDGERRIAKDRRSGKDRRAMADADRRASRDRRDEAAAAAAVAEIFAADGVVDDSKKED